MVIWIENTDKPTRLTVQPTANRKNTQSKNTLSSSQTANTSGKAHTSNSFSNHEKKSTKNHSAKNQYSRGPPQGHGKMIKDPVQVHNEIVWGVPMDKSHTSRRSPSRSSEGDRRGRSRRKPSDYYPIRLK